MDDDRLLELMIDTARGAGFEVRAATTRDEGMPSLVSNWCRVRGRVWIVLSTEDTLAARIDVVARALRDNAEGDLAHRFLPPAVRDRLESAAPGDPLSD